jgi:hydroxymethylbilane synthase
MTALRIGTRESRLALWQAETVLTLLKDRGVNAELVPIKSEGDVDLHTPLYEMGVQGIFTRSLDIALLEGRIDMAVHSYKDVPTVPAKGIDTCAILKRGNHKDLLVYKNNLPHEDQSGSCIIATSSMRRRAQWLHRYPGDTLENLRGNVNTRLKKLEDGAWDAALFAAAGLERIGVRPEKSVELDWMLPAPAQGAIVVVCRSQDNIVYNACRPLNDADTEICTAIERAFLRELMGGCAVPISAFAVCDKNEIYFKGNILSVDGVQKLSLEKTVSRQGSAEAGKIWARELMEQGASEILEKIRNAGNH